MRAGITSTPQPWPTKVLDSQQIQRAAHYLRTLERVEEWLADAPEDAGALRTAAAEIHAARVALAALLS